MQDVIDGYLRCSTRSYEVHRHASSGTYIELSTIVSYGETQLLNIFGILYRHSLFAATGRFVRLLVTKPNITPAMLLKKYSAQEDRAKLAGLVGVTEALDMRMLCRLCRLWSLVTTCFWAR